MNTTTHTVTLRNGKQVLWDEFVTWSSRKQGTNLPSNNPIDQRKSKPWSLSTSLLHSSFLKASYATNREVTRNIGAANGSAKTVATPAGLFPSRISAAKHYGVSSKKMYGWIKSDLMPDFYYLEKLDPAINNVGSKSVSTPAGNFDSLGAAARYYQVTPLAIKNWIKKQPDSGFRYHTHSPNNGVKPHAKPLMTSAGNKNLRV